jgi:hypothetical protein
MQPAGALALALSISASSGAAAMAHVVSMKLRIDREWSTKCFIFTWFWRESNCWKFEANKPAYSGYGIAYLAGCCNRTKRSKVTRNPFSLPSTTHHDSQVHLNDSVTLYIHIIM